MGFGDFQSSPLLLFIALVHVQQVGSSRSSGVKRIDDDLMMQ
jgi:hypothetical protein